MPSNTQVRDLMSRPVQTLERNDKLTVADRTMNSERIRHLPVLDDSGRVVGIVSQRDLFLSALVRALGFGSASRDRTFAVIPVKEVMTENVVTTSSDTPISAGGATHGRSPHRVSARRRGRGARGHPERIRHRRRGGARRFVRDTPAGSGIRVRPSPESTSASQTNAPSVGAWHPPARTEPGARA